MASGREQARLRSHLDELVVEVVCDVAEGVPFVQQDLVNVAAANGVDALLVPPVGDGVLAPVLKETQACKFYLCFLCFLHKKPSGPLIDTLINFEYTVGCAGLVRLEGKTRKRPNDLIKELN